MPGGLLTDLYELNMAASYLRRSVTGQATFSLFIRMLPRSRGFLVTAGLADCLQFLEDFSFTPDDLTYLREACGYPEETLRALAGLRFTGEVRAVPEGHVVFAGEPLLEVTAPIAEAQLAETVLLNHVTFQTAVATKAARCVLAAGGAQLVDFSFRRTQGIDAGLAVARASAIAGFTATSNVAAARRYGLAAAGTMAHSFIEAFGDEQAAFAAFAEDFPGITTFLVDTYDTARGVRNAIEVTRKLRLPGPVGVRLDSGDLAALARMARAMLDEAGLGDARIFASGSLDEYAIAGLVAAAAPVDAYGVGTKMGVSADAPYLDSAYKLVAYDGRPVMKLSAGKVSAPGAKQVHRGPDGDVLALRDEVPPLGHEPLLVPVMREGRRLSTPEPLAAAQRRCCADLAWLPQAARALRYPEPVPVRISERLKTLQDQVSRDLRRRVAVYGPRGLPDADRTVADGREGRQAARHRHHAGDNWILPLCGRCGELPAHHWLLSFSRHDQRTGLVIDIGAGHEQGTQAGPIVMTAQQQVNRVRVPATCWNNGRDHWPGRAAAGAVAGG